jgi:hypothetical protein
MKNEIRLKLMDLVQQTVTSVDIFVSKFFPELTATILNYKDEGQKQFQLIWYCDSKDKLSELKDALKKEYPGIFKEFFPEQDKLIYFVNREKELKKILHTNETTGYILTTPLGYGKTTLLKEKLKQEIDVQNISESLVGHIYIDFKRNEKGKSIDDFKENKDSAVQIKKFITDSLGLDSDSKEEIHFQIIHKIESFNYEKVYLIFDSFESILEANHNYNPEFDEFINNLIYNIKDSANYALVIILAGRNADTKSYEFQRIQDKELRLTEFDEDIILKAIKNSYNYSKQRKTTLDFMEKNNLHKRIWQLTGGHPKCILEIINKEFEPDYKSSSIKRILSDNKYVINEYVSGIINETLIDISTFYSNYKLSKEEINNIMSVISVFRRFSHETIKAIQSKTIINQDIEKTFQKDSFDILKFLININIFKHKGGVFYGDSIIRHLFLNNLINNEEQLFFNINEIAIQTYKEWLNEDILKNKFTMETEIILIEYLYHLILDSKYKLKLKKDSSIEFINSFNNLKIEMHSYIIEIQKISKHENLTTNLFKALMEDKEFSMLALDLYQDKIYQLLNIEKNGN